MKRGIGEKGPIKEQTVARVISWRQSDANPKHSNRLQFPQAHIRTTRNQVPQMRSSARFDSLREQLTIRSERSEDGDGQRKTADWKEADW